MQSGRMVPIFWKNIKKEELLIPVDGGGQYINILPTKHYFMKPMTQELSPDNLGTTDMPSAVVFSLHCSQQVV